MKCGDDLVHDPVQHAFEAEDFQVQRRVVAISFGQACVVNPDPQVPQHQRQGDEEQSQVGILRACIDARLTHLAIARFDAEPSAIAIADLGRRTMHAPGREQQLLFHLLAILAVPVSAITHAHIHRDLFAAVLHRVLIPTRRSPLDRVQAFRRTALLRFPPAKHDRHQERQLLLLQELHDRDVEEGTIQQNTLDGDDPDWSEGQDAIIAFSSRSCSVIEGRDEGDKDLLGEVVRRET